ncbi:hypothetical protein J3R83DRAFT_13923 [Lanmaoa asiatica]|nr:hypothetical protein J3R83DRAFT_13923 [Lanmaoa asiatica]
MFSLYDEGIRWLRFVGYNTGVPDNFVHIQLNRSDIASFPHAEYPGRVISTSSVTARSIEPPGEATSCPFTYDFTLSSSEAALLILPKGAENCKLRKRQIFRDVAIRNAADWYNFAEQHLGRIITHDSLYLITGLYKTSSWSVAAFHQATGTAQSSAQFKASQVGDRNNVSCTWETMRALDWRVGPQIDVRIPNQSVFISGFKIAIRESILGRKRVEVEVDTPPARSRSLRFSIGGSGPGHSRAGNLWRRLVSKGGSGGRQSAEKTLPETCQIEIPLTISSSAPQSDDAGATGDVTINHIPQPLQSLHPSDVINRYLLSKEPSASVAITHDSQWTILFEKGLSKLEDLGHDDRLEKIMSENYRLISQEGRIVLTMHLTVNSDSSLQRMDIDDAARKAWKKDKLDDAEEILSKQLIHRMGSDHSAFANRALVRARLHHWDAALRDAETSIDIQPSVTAHVAKGFALFGQQKYASGVHAFNAALHECDDCDKVIVSLVKSIVLFEVGYHAESMASIAELIEHCPVELKSACSAAHAEMYVRLATLATKDEGYDRALQLLTCAQSLGPFHVVPELAIVSLICGWRFDNLQFSAHQQKCEVLYAVGRTREGGESLLKMINTFGEDVYKSGPITKWVSGEFILHQFGCRAFKIAVDFTQRCLSTPESDGDLKAALRDETTVPHAILILATPTPLLREWAKATLVSSEWKDALIAAVSVSVPACSGIPRGPDNIALEFAVPRFTVFRARVFPPNGGRIGGADKRA